MSLVWGSEWDLLSSLCGRAPPVPDRRGSCPGPGVGAPEAAGSRPASREQGRSPGAGGLVTCEAGAAGPGRAEGQHAAAEGGSPSGGVVMGTRGGGCGEPRGVMAARWRRAEGAEYIVILKRVLFLFYELVLRPDTARGAAIPTPTVCLRLEVLIAKPKFHINKHTWKTIVHVDERFPFQALLVR